jgi:hypothetical protein
MQENINFVITVFFKSNLASMERRLKHLGLRLIKVKARETAMALNYICIYKCWLHESIPVAGYIDGHSDSWHHGFPGILVKG